MTRRKISLVSMILIVLVSLFMGFGSLTFNKINALRGDHDIIYIESSYDLYKLTDTYYQETIFRLGNDIDLNQDTSWHAGNANYINGWEPLNTLGMSGNVFDGGGYSIINLKIIQPNKYNGFFSQNTYAVKNLTFKNVDITGGENSGALAGKNSGQIDNVHVEGNVSSASNTGGIVGDNYGDFNNCSFEGNVSGKIAGGLVGTNNGASIFNSYSNGKVSGQKIGGLISTAYKSSSENVKIANSFSFCELIEVEYDQTVKRIGGFIAIRESDVIIEDCFAANIFPCIAFGDFKGVRELSEEKRKEKLAFENFDFDNYWNWSNEISKISQRTIAVSSNVVKMDSVQTIIKGDREYYNVGEEATLSIFAGDNSNIRAEGAFIGSDYITFDDGKYVCKVANQINLNFTAQYLLQVELNKAVQGGELKQEKKYYAPSEDIFFEVISENHYTIKSFSAKYNGQSVSISQHDGNIYRAYISDITDEYTKDSILFIDVSFEYHPPFNWFVLLWIGLGLCGAAVIFLIILKFRKLNFNLMKQGYSKESVKKISNMRVYVSLIISFLMLICVGGITAWILFLSNVLVVPNLQVLFIITIPIIVAASIFFLRYTIVYYKRRKADYTNESQESSNNQD